MKSIAIYLILSFLISFSIQNSETVTEPKKNNKKHTTTKKHTTSKKHTTTKKHAPEKKYTPAPCESKCMACQQAAYNIKFYQTPNCKNNHCKATVIF